MPGPIDRGFYARPTLRVARALIGARLCHRTATDRVLRARIVETEAYIGERDQACHARFGRTPRARTLYGEPGHAYVYLIYGMHQMLNVVTEPADSPAAVLIRGVELLEAETRRPCPGPGRVTRALGIDRRHNGIDLCADVLWIEPARLARGERVARSPRIGIDYARPPWTEKPWRFFLLGSKGVSRY